jgi:hypothetical protein
MAGRRTSWRRRRCGTLLIRWTRCLCSVRCECHISACSLT